MSHNDIYQARRDAYDQAFEAAHCLTDLIDPSDILEGAKRWSDIGDDRLDMEVSECLDVAQRENQHNGAIQDLAVTIRRGDMPRAPMEDLAFDDPREAVKEGYWPNSMTKMECEDILFETDIHHDYTQEAWETVRAAIYDKSHPRQSHGDSL